MDTTKIKALVERLDAHMKFERTMETETEHGAYLDYSKAALLRELLAELKLLSEGRMVAVPVEPTEAMLSEFQNGMKREFGIKTTAGYHGRIYRAMLAASQKEGE